MPARWIEKWRLDRVTLNPVKVRVMDVGNNFFLVEGEDHTTYKGDFFNAPADAFAAAHADCDRSIRTATEKKERLDRAEARFSSTPLTKGDSP